MTLRRFPRSTVPIVISLSCACATSKDAESISDTRPSTHAEAPATPSATQAQPTTPTAPQHPPEPSATSQPRSGDGQPPATQAGSDPVAYEPWSPCVQTSRVVGDRFKTPWGQTPRDVLGIAMGSHRATLTWQRESAFSYGVEGTTTTLLVEITPKEPATFVERDGSFRCDTEPCMAYECSSELLIPVHIKAVTQDGVISIEQDSELAVSSSRYIETSVGQSFATHRGTLRIRDIREKGLVLDGFGISFGFSRKRTMVGAIRGNYEITNVGALYVEYACFPAEPPPELRDSDEAEVGCRS